MKRRMPEAERVRLEAILRPIMARYAVRALESEHLRTSAQSMTRLVQEVLQRGCLVHASSTGDGLRLSGVQRWLVDMEWVLRELDRELGPLARHVVIFRLTRPQKTELSSFARIAHDLTLICRQLGRSEDLLMPEAEALYKAALPRVVRLLQERGIGCGLPTTSETAVSSDRTAYRPMDVAVQRRVIAIAQRMERLVRRRQRRRRDPNRLHDVRHGARI